MPQLREYSLLTSDDDPLYDSVASDDDYEQVPDEEEVNNYKLLAVFC